MAKQNPILSEPSLQDVLDDAIVALLMERDHVDREQFCRLVRRMRRHLRTGPPGTAPERRADRLEG
ncbi:MAG TPA: hypothetical protein VF194_03920 [Ferrovibrio sp.]|jgi:hypothetical protein|uniref:hypothetical protein n=1 Tax=Ferrovibrio sp. TaxID=1917215 RepID=UPI002ED1E50F